MNVSSGLAGKFAHNGTIHRLALGAGGGGGGGSGAVMPPSGGSGNPSRLPIAGDADRLLIARAISSNAAAKRMLGSPSSVHCSLRFGGMITSADSL